ncbi:MAG: methyltransferase domain-containing protein [Gammaproteobacteria bacterium]|nr:methyltransferase domain-containing protein [Gammaproteobacteria bacterium]
MQAIIGQDPRPAFDAIKSRQREAWRAGDYAAIGTTLQIVGEQLCETLDLHAGSRVLDVAAGNGNATLAAARRFCDVTSTDYVPALLERGAARAHAEGLEIAFSEADAEALPFDDASFDVVLSTFGVMFAPDQARAAAELLRVCRAGGLIGLSNWTPDGFIGQVFALLGRHLPPAPGLQPPSRWGTRAALEVWFGPSARSIAVHARRFMFRYPSPRHFIAWFRDYYGPIHQACIALGERAPVFEAELLALLDAHNLARDGTLVLPSEYVDVVITKA